MMKSGGMKEETIVDFSSSIYDEAQRLIGLVSDIMKLSELDEGAVLLEKESVDLYSLAQSVASSLAPVAQKQNVTVNIIGTNTYVAGVRKILDEMLYNLCDNAIKYNKSGGTVDIILTSSENGTQLIVHDTGIGIPVSEQTRVFERFYRVDKSRSKSAGGTGLGLAIVKHSALFHGATLRLESIEGAGTTVSITFRNAYA